MRRLVLCLLAASGLLSAQVPRIGAIDFYGLHRIPEERLRKTLGAGEGDRLPASKGDLEDRVERLGGVVRARIEAVCCDGDRVTLFVGIEEKDAPHFEFRLPPREPVTLPAAIVETYRAFLRTFEQAARGGNTAENIARGEAVSADPATRALQQRFREFAAANLDALRRALRTAMDPEQRAIAACVIGYAPKKQAVIDDLQYAMQDYDESVRANAMRSLGAIAALASRDPDLGIRVEPTWFIEMLNSIVWSDRTRSAAALVSITENRRPYALQQMRERALDSLVEMARWKSLPYALPAVMLLGRIAGLSDPQTQQYWTKGDREAVIRMALKAPSAP